MCTGKIFATLLQCCLACGLLLICGLVVARTRAKKEELKGRSKDF